MKPILSAKEAPMDQPTKSKVDKTLCTKLLERGLVPTYERHPFRPIREACFLGLAKHWCKFNEPDFQKFAGENRILADTAIVIWETAPDVFAVTRRRDMD